MISASLPVTTWESPPRVAHSPATPLAAGVSSTWDTEPTLAFNCLKHRLEHTLVQKSPIQEYQLSNISERPRK